MCILFIHHTKQEEQLPWKLVVASNRDEFVARPATPAHWWTDSTSVPILAGKDATAGGTWFGITMDGRLAVLTNQRRLSVATSDIADVVEVVGLLRSRGYLLLEYLQSEPTVSTRKDSTDNNNNNTDDVDRVASYIAQLQRATTEYRYNGFNLLLGDLTASYYTVVSQPNGTSQQRVTQLAPDTPYCISNADFPNFNATNWPKIVIGEQRFSQVIREAQQAGRDDDDDNDNGEEALLRQLLALLSDTTQYGEQVDPDPTSRLICVPLLTRSDGASYATRVSTVLLVDHQDRAVLVERQMLALPNASDKSGEIPGSIARVMRFRINQLDSIANTEMTI